MHRQLPAMRLDEVAHVGAEPEATDYLALFDLNVRRLAAALP